MISCRPIAAALAIVCSTLATSSAARAKADFVSPVFVIPYASDAAVFDYRPTINAAGTRIVFERSFYDSKTAQYDLPTNLYITGPRGSAPSMLVPNNVGAARPDWCWDRQGGNRTEAPIAFSVTQPFANPGVYVYDFGTDVARFIPGSANHIYPTWFPDCRNLAIDVPDGLAVPGIASTPVRGPTTRKVDVASGDFIRTLSGSSVWAGFPSVDRADSRLIVFAGQPFTASGYDQDKNYIYRADNASNPPLVKPLDPAASVNIYNPQQQGRAPTVSPDGEWIAFESNRNCHSAGVAGQYALFLQDIRGSKPARQITVCAYDAQHAKWIRNTFKGRSYLIATVRLHACYRGTDPKLLLARGIASLDVTEFLRVR